MTELRITVQVLKVIRVFLARGLEDRTYGLQLMQLTGLKSGTLYPILARLEQAGWIISEWEAVKPSDVGRPRRRNYKLTGAGQAAGLEAMQEYRQLAGPTTAQPPRPRLTAWGLA
ncbi:PadR family transcriptional regulator [Kribbella sp. VKM Ac-2527]|uniref:PadR family transcriptional regulator n=1 Tax=Kribbella caucasensis TaxID=2512215 RepID=A0A4V3C4Y8_9ACTN|nr:helix-turn-helix transcriptional regulator [Kribbella sp. VKM Ac-2527]TDO27808.1 PadR family transcriptional regulator [Kribbella sp. VKM Ac-2527]